MCEILLRVVSKVNPDSEKDLQCTKRGDAIVVQEDGWNWGTDELTSPEWRIIKLPGLSAALVLSMVEPEYITGTDGFPVMRRKRAKYYDIDSLSNQVKNKIMNATEPLTFTVSEQTALRALEKVKPAL